MLIIPYVCAEFRDKRGSVIHRITPEMRGIMQEAPDAIRQDLLFGMLVADGSIRTPESVSQQKTLEQDPMVGVDAEGRSAVIAGEDENSGKTAKPAKASGKARADGKAAETVKE